MSQEEKTETTEEIIEKQFNSNKIEIQKNNTQNQKDSLPLFRVITFFVILVSVSFYVGFRKQTFTNLNKYFENCCDKNHCKYNKFCNDLFLKSTNKDIKQYQNCCLYNHRFNENKNIICEQPCLKKLIN